MERFPSSLNCKKFFDNSPRNFYNGYYFYPPPLKDPNQECLKPTYLPTKYNCNCSEIRAPFFESKFTQNFNYNITKPVFPLVIPDRRYAQLVLSNNFFTSCSSSNRCF